VFLIIFCIFVVTNTNIMTIEKTALDLINDFLNKGYNRNDIDEDDMELNMPILIDKPITNELGELFYYIDGDYKQYIKSIRRETRHSPEEVNFSNKASLDVTISVSDKDGNEIYFDEYFDDNYPPVFY